MAIKTITAANSQFVLTLLANGLAPAPIPVPFQLEGYAADAAFLIDPVESAETIMGVDGRMSAGFLPTITAQQITLMPDSPSIEIFETWFGAQKALRELFFANGSIALPSVGKSYVLTKGALKRVTQAPPVGKVLQPMTYQIDWNDVQPVPLVL
jgi:hypothetical protein